MIIEPDIDLPALCHVKDKKIKTGLKERWEGIKYIKIDHKRGSNVVNYYKLILNKKPKYSDELPEEELEDIYDTICRIIQFDTNQKDDPIFKYEIKIFNQSTNVPKVITTKFEKDNSVSDEEINMDQSDIDDDGLYDYNFTNSLIEQNKEMHVFCLSSMNMLSKTVQGVFKSLTDQNREQQIIISKLVQTSVEHKKYELLEKELAEQRAEAMEIARIESAEKQKKWEEVQKVIGQIMRPEIIQVLVDRWGKDKAKKMMDTFSEIREKMGEEQDDGAPEFKTRREQIIQRVRPNRGKESTRNEVLKQNKEKIKKTKNNTENNINTIKSPMDEFKKDNIEEEAKDENIKLSENQRKAIEENPTTFCVKFLFKSLKEKEIFEKVENFLTKEQNSKLLELISASSEEDTKFYIYQLIQTAPIHNLISIKQLLNEFDENDNTFFSNIKNSVGELTLSAKILDQYLTEKDKWTTISETLDDEQFELFKEITSATSDEQIIRAGKKLVKSDMMKLGKLLVEVDQKEEGIFMNFIINKIREAIDGDNG